MLFGKYNFLCGFEDDAALPEYKGSTFRGVFGHALKKVVCALRRQTCEDCLLRHTCVYAFVFEGFHEDAPFPEKKRIAAPPNAYVIEPPSDSRTKYHRGESFEFTLLLFGRANEYLPYFIYAMEQIGKAGIGKRINDKAGSFELKKVTADGHLLYSSERRSIKNIKTARQVLPSEFVKNENKKEAVQDVQISLLTPLRLKYQSRLEPDLPFHILIRACLRRISSLLTYHGPGEPPLDYKGLVYRAMNVETKESSIKWFDWRRYSNRQEQAMLLGGMVGSATYADVPHEYLPILRFCEDVHLGKQTTFGLGKLKVEFLEP